MTRSIRWVVECWDDGRMGLRAHVEGSDVPSPGSYDEFMEDLIAQGCDVTALPDGRYLVVGDIPD